MGSVNSEVAREIAGWIGEHPGWVGGNSPLMSDAIKAILDKYYPVPQGDVAMLIAKARSGQQMPFNNLSGNVNWQLAYTQLRELSLCLCTALEASEAARVLHLNETQAVALEADPNFQSWVMSLPVSTWAKKDLHVARMGWNAANAAACTAEPACPYIKDEKCELAEPGLRVLYAQLQDAQREAGDWKHEYGMFARAWQRELGNRLAPKTHLIDALVTTTRTMVKQLAVVAAERDATVEEIRFLRETSDPLIRQGERAQEQLAVVRDEMVELALEAICNVPLMSEAPEWQLLSKVLAQQIAAIRAIKNDPIRLPSQ